MKKMKVLALAACFASASSLMASDLYITGSTAFRANVYSACTKLFDAAPKIVYGPTSTGGDGTATSGNPQWTMVGSVSNLLGNVVSGPFTIHGYFTGSIQGTKVGATTDSAAVSLMPTPMGLPTQRRLLFLTPPRPFRPFRRRAASRKKKFASSHSSTSSRRRRITVLLVEIQPGP